MIPSGNRRECYLCGAPATTEDHVPPQGMFPKPRPHNLIKVPACGPCNNGRSLDDEYFRLVVAALSDDSPQSMVLLHQRILPRAREHPALIVRFLNGRRMVPAKNPGRIPIGRRPEVKIELPRIQAVIDKIVRGLFFKHTGRRLGEDSLVEDFLFKPAFTELGQAKIINLPLFLVGDGTVFSYRYELPDSTGCESAWFLMFYNDTSLFVATTTSLAGAPQTGERSTPSLSD